MLFRSDTVVAQSLNLGGYKTSGVDLQIDWRFDTSAVGLRDGGRINVNIVTAWLDTFKIKSLPAFRFVGRTAYVPDEYADRMTLNRVVDGRL